MTKQTTIVAIGALRVKGHAYTLKASNSVNIGSFLKQRIPVENIQSFLTLSTLGEIFSRHIEIFFLIFPRKQVLTFHANCLQWRQFA